MVSAGYCRRLSGHWNALTEETVKRYRLPSKGVGVASNGVGALRRMLLVLILSFAEVLLVWQAELCRWSWWILLQRGEGQSEGAMPLVLGFSRHSNGFGLLGVWRATFMRLVLVGVMAKFAPQGRRFLRWCGFDGEEFGLFFCDGALRSDALPPSSPFDRLQQP